MTKSRDAFRTISEVSAALDTPAHVLRFWESKFSQVKPVKRAGGRRYYRPNDVELLAGIKKLLHTDGMTIKGAQKLLREQGVKSVAAIGAEILDLGAGDVIEAKAVPATKPEPAPETKSADTPDLEVAASTPAPELTINLAPKAESHAVAQAEPAPVEAEPAVAAQTDATPDTRPDTAPHTGPDTAPAQNWRDIPADPADSTAKAPARIFHLIQKASAEGLASKAEQIAPLLDRMQVLRDRIAAR